MIRGRGIPGLGQLVDYHRDPLGVLSLIATRDGDIGRFHLGPQVVFLVNRPELIRQVFQDAERTFVKGRAMQQAKRLVGEGLLTSEGELHRRQRDLVKPAFHARRLGGYSETIVRLATGIAEGWSDGETIDVEREMTRLSQLIVAKTLFGADVEADADDVCAAMADCMDYLNSIMLPFLDVLAKVPVPATRRFARARARLDALVYGVIDDWRSCPQDRGDLLSMLLLARDRDGREMADAQVHDEVITFFLAGHETLASALTWSWYLLSENPYAESALHVELDEVLGSRRPTAGDVPRLGYTRAVFAEALRLYPPAWAVARRALRDVRLGEQLIPAGAIVLLSQYVTHRDRRCFAGPETFDPERWRDDRARQVPPLGYFPFGAGPRRCVGEGFAWMEGVLVLAAVAQHRSLRLARRQPVELLPLVTLRPRRGMPMSVSRR